MTQAFDYLVDWDSRLSFKTSYVPQINELVKKHERDGEIRHYDLYFSFYMSIEEALLLEIR
jgi:hypothetical protein